MQKAVGDARAVAAAYRKLGFDVIKGENVDRAGFAGLWQAFLDRIGRQDVAAFYFSGHGVALQGVNHLLLRDVPKVGPGQDALLRQQSISFDTLLQDLRAKNPRLSLIILDACRDNPLADRRTKGVGGTRGLGRVDPPEGTFVMYSAGAGQTALDRLSDSDRNPNSVYTRALLPLLTTPGLSLTDIARRVRRRVRDLARKAYHTQTPAYYDEVIGDPFCLVGPCTMQMAAAPPRPHLKRHLRPGEPFQDCPACPKMVVLPAGKFMMGSDDKEWERSKSEGPRHEVIINSPFAVGKFEVTFKEWDACVADGGCNGYRPSDEGWGRGRRPVIHVSWHDAQAYVMWLSRKTGKPYRLLTEAEWEYAARAGTQSRYAFRTHGDKFPVPPSPHTDHEQVCKFANGADLSATKVRDRNTACDDGFPNTSPAGSFKPNGFGLHDMAGNVWEWVEDCWHDSHRGAPRDGSARTGGACEKHVMRGGSWATIPRALRSAFRAGIKSTYRDDDAGFRVARDLE